MIHHVILRRHIFSTEASKVDFHVVGGSRNNETTLIHGPAGTTLKRDILVNIFYIILQCKSYPYKIGVISEYFSKTGDFGALLLCFALGSLEVEHASAAPNPVTVQFYFKPLVLQFLKCFIGILYNVLSCFSLSSVTCVDI